MSSISVTIMRDYLRRSISINSNKLNGLLAEIDFRHYLKEIGFHDRVSIGGWIARSRVLNDFGKNTIVMFPETILPGVNYCSTRELPDPNYGLHAICATFHQIGIKSYFCVPIIFEKDNPESIKWKAVELGLPTQQPYKDFFDSIQGFEKRHQRYNFLRYNTTSVKDIPEIALPEEFTKENLRVSFSTKLLAEISDIDGILWGQQNIYPLEIKEKTAAFDRQMGEYFGLDIGPFVKLAFYAAKRGSLHSLFIVREINNTAERKLVNWWYITFERLASYASWVPSGGGRNMQGGGSTVVRIPKNQFTPLNADTLANL